jgi:3-dehydroquinate synthase/2-deoxy-scyllo-inosose synthase
MEYLEAALSWGVTRKSLIITLGGGIPGNIGGLLASLLFRGIRFVHIPTTVVGMFDSVLSLKQAINGSKAKNLIGVFSKPQAIFGDLTLLRSLSKEHMRSGLCETIKNALSISPEDLEPLRTLLVKMMQGDIAATKEIFQMNVDAKLKVMRDDKFEKKRAVVLEYGHTLGHAIEICIARQNLPISISHGEAVGIGMVAAAEISAKLGCLNRKAVDLHYEYLNMIGSPVKIPAELSLEEVLKSMLFDNKRGYIQIRENEIAMVLLKELGLPQGNLNCPLVPVAKEIVLETLQELQERQLQFSC